MAPGMAHSRRNRIVRCVRGCSRSAKQNREALPGFFNDPVPSFGSLSAPLLIVGLAPGLKGANRTGRPFTGDYAGDLLYALAQAHRLGARRHIKRAPTTVSSSSACASPMPCAACRRRTSRCRSRSTLCRQFLIAEIAAMQNLRAILALGADRA